ncbi:hypothetical protein SORDD16_01804 [Streptococcus oralis]|uniref:Helicase/UvrB N-terminal domain-containing protein n=1 Tax=Streptococcus oralis TaxID=1303 RepID=A0A139P8S6_STROR|nr:hypothetical protein SORDD16_01804 [Streptococcus oralis]
MLDLKFKGRWRKYQKEVLDRFQSYQTDGHVHLVAPPGTGKTTIDIELIARFGNSPLVLTDGVLSWINL